MTIAYLGLGSNVGDRGAALATARRILEERGAAILRETPVEETEPWGKTDQPRFLNQVLEVEWNGTAHELLEVARSAEAAAGRIPRERWGPRELDVDILVFGDERIAEDGLKVPHPHIADREFVKKPLESLGVTSERW